MILEQAATPPPFSRPQRRPVLALALAASLGAHAALAATFWIDSAAQPEAGAVIDVEIASLPGAAAASASTASAAVLARPAAAPQAPMRADPAYPREASARFSAEPRQNQATPAAESVPLNTTQAATAAPKLRAAAPAEPVSAAPREAAPPKSNLPPSPRQARAIAPQGPAARRPTGEIASTETAPGAGQAAATPPRYGLGSAANPLPKYPEAAREQGWEGVVLLTVAVAADGRAESVGVERSSGYGTLDKAALEAVRRWRFEPARRAGIPVTGTVSVPIRFRLDD